MEDRRSHSELGLSSRRGSAEAATDYAGKGKKNRTPSLENDECMAAAGTDVTGAWTGEKKTKIQHSPTSGDFGKVAKDDDGQSSGKVLQEQEEGPELLEGLDWGLDELNEKIDCFEQQLNRELPDNDDFWVHCDDKQRRELNERLALYRIRAHEEKHRKMEVADLKVMYPGNVLEDKGYFEFYERYFDWYFDPKYCNYARFQDYQRIVIRNNDEYEDWEDYRKACSTLEGDKEFVWLWEKLLSNTKLIEHFLTDSSHEVVLLYHMLKIAAKLSHVYKPLIHSGFIEFMWSVRFDETCYKYYAGFLFEIWKKVAKQKMTFKEALKAVYCEGKYTLCRFERKCEFESDDPRPGFWERLYNTHLGPIDGKAEEGGVYQLIMEVVKKTFPKPKKYYDYAKRKLDIAKEIGLIPPSST